jgi:transcriptional regulator with XRE-family HTH domain
MTAVTFGSPTRSVTQVRRAELATFLRARRERLAPEDVGLPPSLRRRTPGLRREEVAQLAGVGVTWYTWLEQGRPINASTQVLDSIARTLQLDGDEHQHLYRLADVPAVANPVPLDPAVGPVVQAILDDLSLPASVLNERYDLLGWNKAYKLLFPSVLAASGPYRNIMWSLFAMPGCCHPVLNRLEELPYMVATLRAAYGRHVGERCWEQFIHDLIDKSPEFARMWEDHQVGGYGSRDKLFKHPAEGVLQFKSTSLGVHAAPGLRVVVYVAADEATSAAMTRLGDYEINEVIEAWTQPCVHQQAAATSA